jgi:hypothetical protein
MYRVVTQFKVVPFDSYSEALAFKQQYGGKIYQKIGSYKYEN